MPDATPQDGVEQQRQPGYLCDGCNDDQHPAEDCWPCNTDDGRLVLCPDYRDERSVEPITLTDGGVMSSAREPREAHCQFCGGYAGHGPDPRYCSHCRAAGEHLTTCAMCEEEVPKDEIDEFCSDCRETIDELDRLLEDANDE